MNDSELSGDQGDKKGKIASRSNHQRLLAIDILNSLVKASQKNKELLACLAKNLDVISNVLVNVVNFADSWQQKKVKKTIMALNVYTKTGKVLAQSDLMEQYQSAYVKGANQIIKAVEAACEKDKTMGNLKGTIKGLTYYAK